MKAIVMIAMLLPSILLMILVIRVIFRKPKDLVYISGKVTDINSNRVWIKFKLSEIYLRCVGFNVFNPISNLSTDATYDEFTDLCSSALRACDFVYFQNDWLKSIRTRQEFSEAARLDKMLANTNSRTRKFYETAAAIYE